MASEGEKPQGSLVLVGTEGLVEGEVFQVNPGESVVLGRSRSCDISLRKCFKYLALDPEERKDDRHFQTVSRRHLRLTFKDSEQVEVENMGANGTYIDEVIITDIRHQSHEVLLGTREKFRLEWREEGLPAPKPASTFDEGAPAPDAKEDRVCEGPTKRVAQKPGTEKGQGGPG
jgi:pSer/pThr/pTyr-binding forkhead associated (FHA) protein